MYTLPHYSKCFVTKHLPVIMQNVNMDKSFIFTQIIVNEFRINIHITLAGEMIALGFTGKLLFKSTSFHYCHVQN